MKTLLNALGAALLAACGSPPPAAAAVTAPVRFGAIDAPRLAQADAEPSQWLSGGGNAAGSYFSRLSLINQANAKQLGFAWEYALHSTRGLEATPIVVDGVLYTSGNWGRVYALDAATGRERWVYDPEVDAQWARSACCDAVNRGVAVWQGRVYVAALDGYLHAIDAASGRRIWKADTLAGRGPKDFHYFVSGAPLVADDLIVIGNGGADFRGARGSVAAFDASSGALRWRFYTVPRDPKLGAQDQPHLAAAAGSWDPHYDWATGGGGSVWDGLSYDPKLKLIYFGTANPSPYAIGQDKRGDALFAASMLAVHADSGRLAWFYQEVPGDGWDYDATQKTILADLSFAGRSRAVLLQAAKNGYAYAWDRATGELLSAHPFAFVNWTRGLDPKTQRPIRNPAADYSRRPQLVFPAMTGAHSWQPMSFSPVTGLLYIPVIDAGMVFIETAHRPAGTVQGNFTVVGVLPEDYDPQSLASLFGALPSKQQLERGLAQPVSSQGVLRAIEPASGRVVWTQAGSNIWDGGVLSTAGNLVIRGDAAGYLNVYTADRGQLLTRIETGSSIMAAPMTYRLGGEQFIAVMAGYGGGTLAMPFPRDSAAARFGNAGRLLAFKLGGGAVPKPPPRAAFSPERAPPRQGTPAAVRSGEVLYNRYCGRCHVFGVGLLPDLRNMTNATHLIFENIVLDGAYRGKGMPRWDDVLSRSDVEAIHAYLIDQALAAAAPQ